MIYKYFPPTDNSLDSLRKNSIYFQHYSQFNDPFEFWAANWTGVPNVNPERSRYIEAMRSWGFVLDGFDEEYPGFDGYFEEVNQDLLDFTRLYQQSKVACFCADPKILLMWSHYADGMRGYCAAYDEKLLSQIAPNCHLIEVTYTVSPPTVDTLLYDIAWDQYEYCMMAIEEEQWNGSVTGLSKDFQMAANESKRQMRQIWQQAFATKPINWKYEKEKRLVVLATQRHRRGELRRMPEGTLKEIIVGERMNEDFKRTLLQIASTSHREVHIRRMRTASDEYKLTID